MNYAQAVCDALDELDRTPFGDMGKALDKISDLAVKSAQQAVKLEARIGGAEMSEAMEQFNAICEAWPDQDGVITSVDLKPIRTALALLKED